jgi:hypothetical protein
MRKDVARLAIVLVMALLLSSCAGLEIGVAGGGMAPSASGSSVPAVGNNETVTLQAGTYSGGVRITGNNSTLQGAGVGATTIAGDLIVAGNKVTVRNLTIRGSVRIDANNADLTGARITGSVSSNGNGNRW